MLTVGPGKTYSKPCQAVAAAQAGDTIEIDPGLYQNDFCSLTKNNLTIRGVGSSRPHLQATVPITNKKGIFVVPTGVGPITIEKLELSGAAISASDGNNGAGIRMQGSGLTVRDCYLHDNQNGILSGGTAGYEVLIERSEFASNGNAGSGYEHNIYISGDAKSFTLRYSYSHHARSGHNVKSRARLNYILYNRIMDEAAGTSSYAVDLPQGGRSYLIGNLIQQGPKADNSSTIVSYKAESATNPELTLYAVNNTIVNDNAKTSTSFLRIGQATEVKVVNNLFVGQGTPVTFSAGNPPAAYTNQGNLQTSTPGLVNLAAYDYRLTAGSPAVNKGSAPGTGGGFGLTPLYHYVHKASAQARPTVGVIDVGAYEYGSAPVADGGPAPADGPPPADGPAADGPPHADTTPATDGASTPDGQRADGAPGGDAAALDAPGGDGTAGGGDGRPDAAGDDGCSCRLGGSEDDAAGWPLPLVALALLLFGRRRPRV